MSVHLETRGEHVYVNNQAPSSGGGHRTSVIIEENASNNGDSAKKSKGSDETDSSRQVRAEAESDFELLANETKKRPLPRPMVPIPPPPPPPRPSTPVAPPSRPLSPHTRPVASEEKTLSQDEQFALRRKKMRLLTELEAKTGNPRKLTMDSPLNEVDMELECAKNKSRTQFALSTAQSLLGMACEGINQINTKFDLTGVNMDDWQVETTYQITQCGKYDEPLLQIIAEYESNFQISPIAQIALGLGMGFAQSVRVKKRDLANQKMIRQQQDMLRRQEAELKAHRMQTRQYEKEAWHRRQDEAARMAASEPVPDLQGPALTAEEMRKAMGAAFVPDNGGTPTALVQDAKDAKDAKTSVSEDVKPAQETPAEAPQHTEPSSPPASRPASPEPVVEKPVRRKPAAKPAPKRKALKTSTVALDL